MKKLLENGIIGTITFGVMLLAWFILIKIVLFIYQFTN